MFTISKAQMAQFGTHSRDQFVQRTVAFLKENTPQWAKARDDEEIAQHVRETIEWGLKIGIRKEINVQKVLYHTVRAGRLVDDKDLQPIWSGSQPTENRKVMEFIKYMNGHGSK